MEPKLVRYSLEDHVATITLDRAAGGDVRELGAYVGSTLAYLFTTEDRHEGALAFVERREPVFKGR